MINEKLRRKPRHISSTTDEPIFKLKVKEGTKYARKGEWFKEYIDYLLPYDTTVIDDYKKMKLSYDILNNNLAGYKAELSSYCSPMGEEDMLDNLNQEQILPFNKLPEKANIYNGELLKRNDANKIVLTSHKAVEHKNVEFKAAIRRSIEEASELQIEITKMRFNGASEREISQFKEDYVTQKAPEDLDRKDFQTDWEIFNARALKYCQFEQEIVSKQQLSMKHAIASDRVFLYVGWEYGEPTIKVLNPLHCGFHKSPDVEYVQKGDYFWHKTAITLADAYNKYIDVLDDEQVEELGVYNYNSSMKVDKRHDVLSGNPRKVFNNTTEQMYRSSQDVNDKTIGQAQGQGTNYRYNNTRLLWETHIEFKAFREIVFLSTFDDMGTEIINIVDDKFEIPDYATKYDFTNRFGQKSTKFEWVDNITQEKHSAERLWIPRRYEVTRLGQDVYVNYREVPDQPLNISNPYKNFELSYKGRIFSNVNSESISPVQRAIPFQFQYFIIKTIQMRELSKYQGFTIDIDVDQIPDYLEQDENGEHIPGRDKVSIWKLYLKKLGYNLYSGSQTADGLPPSTRSPGSKSSLTGTAAEMLNLSQLLEFIDREIGMAMGISPQRQANYSAGGNVSDNQQAIAQSHHITEPFFYMHSQVWKHALNDWLRLFRTYVKKIFAENPNKTEHFIEYVTPNNARELLRITPDMLDHEDIGIFLSNSGQDKFYRDSMIQMVHAFGQNAGEGMEVVSSMLKAIAAGDSPEEIHRMIQLESSRQSERMAKQQQAEAEAAKQANQYQTEWREDEQAHDVEIETLRANNKLEVKMIDVYKNQDDLNKDQDGIPDPLEAAMAMHKINAENIALGQKQQELAIAEKKNAQDLVLKKEEIAIKRKQVNKPASSSK